MKLKFKKQAYQTNAVDAVADCFAGQPKHKGLNYRVDPGRAVDASVSVDYFPWKNFGFTLQYSYDDIRLDYEKYNYRGKLDLINQGPQIKAVVKF